jgi:hypothetical protein
MDKARADDGRSRAAPERAAARTGNPAGAQTTVGGSRRGAASTATVATGATAHKGARIKTHGGANGNRGVRREYLTRLASALPEPMLEARRWLLHRGKQPFYVSGAARSGALDSHEDMGRFGSFQDAAEAYKRGGWDGLGFALGPGAPGDASAPCWQGIDLDKIHERRELQQLGEELPGYVEISPSGNGLHAIGLGQCFAALGSNETGIEAYAAGRYFTVTGNAVRGAPEDLSAFVRDTLVPKHGQPRGAQRKATSTAGGSYAGESFFAKVNSKALQSMPAWVPDLFPAARPYHDGFRVSSAALGRNLEEDLSILPQGIRDFGEEQGKTAIDLIVEWGPVSTPKDAALWLCGQMGIDPAHLGWGEERSERSRADGPPPHTDADAPDPGRADRPHEAVPPAAKPAPRLADILEASIQSAERRARGIECPIPLPWPEIGPHFGGGLWPGLHMLCSGTGVGKTQLALQAAAHAARKGFPAFYLGLELGEKDLALRMLGEEAGVPWSALWTGHAGQSHLDRIREAAPKLQELPFHFEVARPHGFPPSAIRTALEALRQQYPEPDGPGSLPILVVLDFLQLVGDEEGQTDDTRIRIGRASYVLRDAANRLGVAVLCISSIARERYKMLAEIHRVAGLESEPDGDGAPQKRRVMQPDAVVGAGKESGELEYSADSVSVLARVADTWDGAGYDVVFVTPKGRATGATWSVLHFTGFRYEEPDDGGAAVLEAWADAKEKEERVREKKRGDKDQAKFDKIAVDAEALRAFVQAHPDCSVREARVHAVQDQHRRWSAAVAYLGTELVQTRSGREVLLSLRTGSRRPDVQNVCDVPNMPEHEHRAPRDDVHVREGGYKGGSEHEHPGRNTVQDTPPEFGRNGAGKPRKVRL